MQPYVLRFSLEAGSTASSDACLYTNYSNKRDAFARTSFEKNPFTSSASSANRVDLLIKTAGVFEFYVEYTTDENDQAAGDLFERKEKSSAVKRGKSGHFNVDPILKPLSASPS